MDFNFWYVIVGALLVLMALMSTMLKRLPLTSAIVYIAIGAGLGPLGLGLIRIDPIDGAPALERLTELVVVISLFTAGLKLRTPLRNRSWRLPLRLATLTMLVSIALATMAGRYLLGLEWPMALLLGAVLAPTDPVLASDVQVEGATDRDRLRFGLTGEAGLNDGSAFPFVMLALGWMGLHPGDGFSVRWLFLDLLWPVAGGLAIGWLLGTATGRLTLYLRRTHEQAIGYEDFLALGLVALAYGAALLLHTYGFLAVFAAGVGLRHFEMRETGVEREPDAVLEEMPSDVDPQTHGESAPAYMARAVLGFSEQMERILEFTVVVILGAMMTFAKWTAPSVAFVVAMLFVVRPLSVLLTTANLPWRQRGYIAWFGIRGIGSLYYLFFAFTHGLQGEQASDLLGVALAMVSTSIVVHGVTVTPLMERYTSRLRRNSRAETPA